MTPYVRIVYDVADIDTYICMWICPECCSAADTTYCERRLINKKILFKGHKNKIYS